ncbi:MAG: hypothetical protein MJ177_00360 [Clostridia bacterium]|nr:hypothetical protein [Clostridia bacterium]
MDFLYNIFFWIDETDAGFLKDSGIWFLVEFILKLILNDRNSDIKIGDDAI